MTSVEVGFIDEMFEVDGFEVNGLVEKNIIGRRGFVGSGPGLVHAVQHAVEVVWTIDGSWDTIYSDDGRAYMLTMGSCWREKKKIKEKL